MIYTGVNHSVNRHQLMYKRKKPPKSGSLPNGYSYIPKVVVMLFLATLWLPV